ncbi:hypothetical protein M0805_004854 [Coniferiporia weirii]|nr:hypothetical protein M0805_004854 [Coniferiporia weirii]
MRPTLACLSKASRRPLTPKRGNKDYYKGTRQSSLPGLRTGAPGKYFGRGNAQYRLLDERVRVFVAPPIEDLNNSPLKPYVPWMTHLSEAEMYMQPFGRLPPGGLTGQIYLDYAKRDKTAVSSALNAAGETIE